MNSLEKPSAEILWDAERYVLGDTSLDRAAFERSMSEDIELALAVADCVERMQHIAVSCRSVEWSSQDASVRWTNAGLARLCLVCAALAAMLVAMVVLSDSTTTKSLPQTTVQNADMSEVAAHWLALDVSSMGEDLSTLPEALEAIDFQSKSQLSAADESDWMLEAAVAFFEQADI